jgi:exonuclease SbcC
MENFRGYADRNNEIEFRPGINLILGDNATGKSTIVVLTLFNLLHKKIDVTKFEDYRTLEPQDLGGYRAKLSIVGADGKEYAIEKILQGKSVKIRVESEGKELKKFGELELTHYKEAQQFILERLGATEEIIENILVQVQDPVKLLWPVGDAKEVGDRLSKLLRFEPLKNVYVNAHSVGRMLADKAEGWDREVREMKKQIEALGLRPPEDYEKEKRELEDQRRAWEKKAEEIRSEIEEIKREKEKIEETISDLQERAGELKGLTKEKEKLEKEVKDREKPEKTSGQLKAEWERLKRSFGELQKEITSVGANVETLKSRVADGEEEIGHLQSQIKKHQEEYEGLLKSLGMLKIEVEIKDVEESERLRKLKQSEYRQLGESIGGLKEQVKIESQYVDILSKAEAACPVCDSSLTDEKRRKIIARRAKRIEGLKDQIERAKEKYEGSEKAIELLEKISSKLKKLADLEESLSKEKKKMDEAKNKLPQALERQKALGERQTELDAEIERTEKLIELSKKFERIEELEAGI